MSASMKACRRVVCRFEIPPEATQVPARELAPVRHPNREAWLQAAATSLSAHVFGGTGFVPPGDVLPSCGFPSRGGLGKTRLVLGECWAPDYTPGGVGTGRSQIFINPIVADTTYALEVLTHELVHAAVGTEHGHKGPFIQASRAIGLERPWKSARAGESLLATLRGVVELVGAYPHAGFEPPTVTPPEQRRNRQRKCVCNACGERIVRMSKKQIADGAVICGRWLTPVQGKDAPRCMGECVEVEDDER